MYNKFYSLKNKPFHIVPNPKFLFMSSRHKNALTYLEYGLAEKIGFIMLTGEIGTGKTTLIRYLLNKIESDMEVAVVFNTHMPSEQILNLIMQEFELSPNKNKAKSIDILYNFLIQKYSEGKRALLIIDEAQNLSDNALEEIRMLSNLQSDEEILLNIMIVGQPELKTKLKKPELIQFSQRIGVSYHLSALNRKETGKYIAHRIKKAGGDPGLFLPEAVELIFQASGGIPRTINLLCDASLVYGFADEVKTIGKVVVEQVIYDKGGMGIITQKDLDPDSSKINIGIKIGEDIPERLQALDKKVSRLQLQVDKQIGNLEEMAENFKDEMVGQYKELYLSERRRNQRLLSLYATLKGKFKILQNKTKN